MSIRPSIGRVVWYFPLGHKTGDQPLAALIAYVWSDSLVNLAAFAASGLPLALTPVPLLGEHDPQPLGGNFATWMAYQFAQQAKHEASAANPGKNAP